MSRTRSHEAEEQSRTAPPERAAPGTGGDAHSLRLSLATAAGAAHPASVRGKV
jgi:hypothetical protein